MKKSHSIFQVTGKDKTYCDIKNEINPRCKEAKIFVESLWKEANSYLDPDLVDKIKNDFHSHFWELYLAKSLLDIGLNLKPSNSSDGPDICIKDSNDLHIWVEAVTALSGNGIDAVKRSEVGVVRDVPDDQIKLRLINALNEKKKKYDGYRNKNWINVKDRYIVAINAALVPSARLETEIPRIIRALLPFGHQVLSFNKETANIVDISYNSQETVVKASGKGVETTSFLNPQFSGISAVIYSCADVLNYPTEISKSLLIFHNPLAENPLPLGFLKNGYEYWVEDQYPKSKNWNRE